MPAIVVTYKDGSSERIVGATQWDVKSDGRLIAWDDSGDVWLLTQALDRRVAVGAVSTLPRTEHPLGAVYDAIIDQVDQRALGSDA